jgi:superkiller protein 3
MKQCRVCGTRNREKYANCVRCGEPLASAPTRAAAGSSGFPPAVKLALTMVVLLGIMIAGFRFMARGTSSSAEIPPAHFDSSSATAEDADLFSIDEALDAEEVDQTLNEASVTTRNGKEAFRAGDYEAALAHFEELARLSPTNYTAYLYAGMCKQKLGDLEGAKGSLRTALEFKPNEALTRKALIKLLIDSDELQEAGELQAWFVADRRFDPEPLLDLARIHRRQGQFDAAIGELQRAAEISSGPEVPLELGTTLAEASRTQEAVSVFETVLEGNPQNARAHAGLGAAYLRSNQYREALAPLEKAVELNPNGPSARFNLAMTYENMDRIEDSLREYEAFVRLAPNDPSAARIAELVERAQAALAERQ